MGFHSGVMKERLLGFNFYKRFFNTPGKRTIQLPLKIIFFLVSANGLSKKKKKKKRKKKEKKKERKKNNGIRSRYM